VCGESRERMRLKGARGARFTSGAHAEAGDVGAHPELELWRGVCSGITEERR